MWLHLPWTTSYEVKERRERKQQWNQRCDAPRAAFLFVSRVDWAEMGHAGGRGNDKLPVGQNICPDWSPPELK